MTANATETAAGLASPISHAAVSRKNLLEPAILPIKRQQRSIGTLGFTWIWIGIAFMIGMAAFFIRLFTRGPKS